VAVMLAWDSVSEKLPAWVIGSAVRDEKLPAKFMKNHCPHKSNHKPSSPPTRYS
jgi:hypothetical protein